MAQPYNDKSVTSVNDRAQAYDANRDLEELRFELASLKSTLAEKADKAYEKVSEGASNAANYVQQEASSVAGTLREHPAATTTLLTLVGVIGFGLGYLVANSSVESRHSWYRRYLNDKFNFS